MAGLANKPSQKTMDVGIENDVSVGVLRFWISSLSQGVHMLYIC